MKQTYKKLSAWMILVGLFLQTSTPMVAAMRSSNLSSSDTVLSGKSDASIETRSLELESSVDVANFNVQGLIEHLVEDAVEQGCENALSSALVRCYKSVSEGETVIDVDTLIEAMPELLEYAVTQEKMRAVRPDAPLATANNAIVACGGDCDLTQLIRLLASIRARIGTVNDNPCCGTILGILGDACNVPCIGEDGSISEVLCEILDCCTTTAAEIKGIFTVLVDIKDTLTECCAEIHVDFEGTWTILADIRDTITVLEDCCACGPIPLFQSDVDGDGEIKLTMTGLSYCLAENITGTIVISASDVTVDGEEHILTGRVVVNGPNAIMHNAKIKPQVPVDNADANNAAVDISVVGNNAQILNCLIECADSSGDGVNGRDGIFSEGEATFIKECDITAGDGANSINGDGGAGGNAISVQGAYSTVRNPIVNGGNGGDSSASGFAGGVGGDGVEIGANNVTVNMLVATAGAGGNGITGTANGGTGGNGIEIVASTGSGSIKTIIITSCTILDGGIGGSSLGGNQGNGGHGIFVNSSDLGVIASDVQICDCNINNVGQATAPGIGGDGIRIDSVDNDTPSTCIQVINTKIIGSAGNGFYVVAGSNIEVKECSASCNGIDGFAIDNGGGIIFDSLNSLHNTGTGIRTGSGFDVQIKDCKAESNGADGIAAGSAGVQVISCCSTSNGFFGINNLGGTQATFYNNIATDNTAGNYFGVSLIRVPGPHTGFYTNVTQGPQDCDLCDLFTIVSDILDSQTLIIVELEDCCACGPIPLFQSDVVGGQILLSTPGKNYCLAENITATIVITGGNVTIEGNDRVLTGPVRIDAADPIVRNLKVEPASPTNSTEATFPAIDITSNGSNAQILNCLVVCAQSAALTPVNGRSGISSAATKTWIKNCNVTAGSANTLVFAGVGGTGGDGIILDGSFGLISDSLVIAGAGGANSGGGSNGGDGGFGARVTGSDVQIINSEFIAGNGGVGQLSGGSAGNGVSLSGLNSEFLNSDATGGNGGNSTLGGAAGSGLVIAASKAEVHNSILTGGTGGTGVSSAGAGGHAISVSTDDIVIADSRVIAGNGANASAGNGGASGSGVFALGCIRITLLNLIAVGGNGGIGSGTGSGGSALNSSINLAGCELAIVKGCNILNGNNGGSAGGLGTGGNGGNGIISFGSTDVQISECRVERVGAGGAGGIAGSDGSGIAISGGSTNVQVTSNYVSGCPGDGIQIGTVTNAQVMSNRVSACVVAGIRNSAGTQAVFANNAATLNGVNYVGVAPVDSIAAPVSPANLNYWTNVTP